MIDIRAGQHKSYELTAGNCDAVVFIHGILGSPLQFQVLADELFGHQVDCVAVLLPGHGGSALDFARCSRAQWQGCIDSTVDRVKGNHDRVFLVGHSLGGLLALDYAARNPIDGLVLINSPLAFRLDFKQVVLGVRMLFSSPETDDAHHSAYRQAYSITSGRFFDYPLWIRQFLSMFSFAGKVKKLLPRVSAKTLIVRSALDESVPRRSAELLKKGLVHSRDIVELKESAHSYFSEGDKQTIMHWIENFIDDQREANQ